MTGINNHSVIRDSIHGDIPIGPIQKTILDTPTFQRLRYIKQNGLLHHIFPGAVHTRFAHSIGTMHVAGRVFTSLFPSYAPGNPSIIKDGSLRYIGQVFETAALLHDCGHCAFSHSIEHVKLDSSGRNFIPSLQKLCSDWYNENDQEYKLLSHLFDEDYINEGHEGLGLLLIGDLANHSPVSSVVKQTLLVDTKSFFKDVRALLCDNLNTSSLFNDSAVDITKNLDGIDQVPQDEIADQLRLALSSLISGTIDVDRMDYVIRDSHYTGTLYGVYDIDLIINALELCVLESGGKTIGIGLHKRACRAVDDFLWSRYQLYEQVVNHKTNVAFNMVFSEAINDLIQCSSLRPPDSKSHILQLTDEYIMSMALTLAINDAMDTTKKTQQRSTSVLVDRKLPTYLGTIDITKYYEENNEQQRQSKINKAIEDHIKTKLNINFNEDGTISIGQELYQARHWETSTSIIKGNLPFIIERDKINSRSRVLPPDHKDAKGYYQILQWSENDGENGCTGIPAAVHQAYIFIDKQNS